MAHTKRFKDLRQALGARSSQLVCALPEAIDAAKLGGPPAYELTDFW
jgi:hypothetical protein